MRRYAEDTKVGQERSRQQIEKLLTRYGASELGYAWSAERGAEVIWFKAHDRRVRLLVPHPDPESFRWTPTQKRRNDVAVEKLHQQALRQLWRALFIIITAKLEAIEAGIRTFEQEFGWDIILPDGRTVGETAHQAISTAYISGAVPPLLPDYTQ